MRLIRPLLALLLTLSLTWASAQGVMAHGPAGQGELVTLCDASGQGITILLDASGRPVPPGQDCPDCLAAQPAALPPGTAALPPQVLTVRPATAPRPAFAGPVTAPQRPTQARAPPVLV